jgi:hypothetical protein
MYWTGKRNVAWLGPGLAGWLLFAAPVRADLEPPVGGRPEHFSGAVGVFRINAEAAPTEVAVEAPIILTVTVTGSVAPDYPRFPPPERLNIDRLGDLQDDFQVDDLAEGNGHPDPHTWTYLYRLRPRNTQVRRIPRLHFVFYNPLTGTWPTSYTAESISLKVNPRPTIAPPEDLRDPAALAADRYPLVTGEAVLWKSGPRRLASVWLLVLMFAAPPVLCLVWYQLWRSWYPDAARLAGRRRSRAARFALRQLRAIPRGLTMQERAAKVAVVLGRYLHQRLDLPSAEPTPAEVAALLSQASAGPAISARFSRFLAICDAARFGLDEGSITADLLTEAAHLIRELEVEPCLCATS